MVDASFKLKMGFTIFLCLVFNLSVLSYAENVPVYIMGLRSSSNYPSASAFGSVSRKEFRANYLDQLLKDHKSLVAFVQDRLSPEDLSKHSVALKASNKAVPHLESNLRKNPSLVLPSVENPVEGLRSLKKTMNVRELKSDSQDQSKESLKPEILIYHLPASLKTEDKKTALRKNDEYMHNVLKDLKASNTDFVALYTGLKPSYNSKSEIEEHYRIARSLKESLEIDVNGDSNFINGTELYLYGKNVTITIVSKSANLTKYTAKFKWPPAVTFNPNGNRSIEVTFAFSESYHVLSGVELSMNVTNSSASGFWDSRNIMFKAKFYKEELNDIMPMKLKAPYELGASKGFSFSCDKTEIKGMYKNTSKGFEKDLSINFQIERFQMEWYPKNPYFSESFDCFTFFTIPIWMGLLTVLLFTAILAFGIFMLFEVKTMDRFDDPKGKTISVPLTE